MKKLFYFLILFLQVHVLIGQIDLCRKSTEGTDFWFGFMESRNYHSNHFIDITVTARETTSFQIFIGKNESPYNGTHTVQANSSKRVSIPWTLAEAIGSETIQEKGVRLVSEKPVNVYALNWDKNSSDVAVIYPVSSLGNEYFAVCYEPHVNENNGNYGDGRNSQFLIVATEDSTEVAIVPSKVTDKLVSVGSTIKTKLNKGEVYQVQSMNHPNLAGQGDLTGSYILADRPVAFYSGSLATTVPAQSGVRYWDHLYEQIPPVYSWGREYYAVPLKSREQDLYRVMAAQDGTTVYIDGFSPMKLDRGEFREFVLHNDQPRRIFSEKPILVAQYSQSQSVDRDYTGGNGDPFMIVLSSTTQTKNDVTFVAYDSDQIQKYYANVISLTEEIGNIRLNGSSVQNQFTPFPNNSEYSWAQITLSPGTYRLWNTNKDRGFLAYVYGFGGVESYGYGVGFNLDLVLDLGESVDFQGDTLLLCYGEKRLLDAGPYFDTYDWNTGDVSQKLLVDQAGKYSVKTTTIDGCELEDSIYVFVSHPEVELGIEDVKECYPFSLPLDGNDGFAKYVWENENGDTLSTNRIYDADKTGEYRISSYDKYNCVARDTMTLTVFPVPDIKIEGDTLLCGELNLSLTVSIANAPEDVWNYDGSFNWSTDKPLQLSFTEEKQKSVQLEASEWGTYKIFYKLTTVDGCETIDTFQVRFHNNPTSLFTFEDDAKCEGYSKKLRYVGQATDSASFYWDLDGCKFVDTLDWQYYDVTVGAFLNDPPYISLVIDDNQCWSDTTTIPLGAKPNFTMDADKLRGCDEMTVNFTSTLLTADNVNFEWEFSDGEVVKQQNAIKHFATTGYYGVSLTITNPVTQCQNGFLLDSMVKVFPTPKASIIADPSFCYEDSTRIIYSNNIDSSFCSWEFEGITQLDDGNDSILIRIDDPTGTVRLIVDEYGCISDPVEMDLKRKPHFDFNTDDQEGCQPYSLEIYSESIDEFINYNWIINDSTKMQGESVYVTYQDSGKFDISLIGTSTITGCVDTLLKPDWLWVHPMPVAEFDVNFPVALIENANISFYNNSESSDYYQWDFDDGMNSNEFEPMHTYLELGEYFPSLIAESIYGCKDSTDFEIRILPFEVFTPNAFRPDSEIPENKIFMPVGLGADASSFNIKIYDRWGQIVFESNTPDYPWDGTTKNGDRAPMGNYVWLAQFIDIQGFKHNQKGQVLLIR
ncbi:PKD domain-containing protein [Sunxiuqinia sp. A32]|uniref:PKD domain-containing protein n=1 Tax=Sunxiuqinia sp. A32 TaxID=3461496 RepID=UPI0040461966